MTGDRCLNGMIHDGKRDGWDMLLAESEAVRKAISYQDTCVPLHPHSMVENESPGFFPGIQDESEKNTVAEAELTASQRPN